MLFTQAQFKRSETMWMLPMTSPTISGSKSGLVISDAKRQLSRGREKEINTVIWSLCGFKITYPAQRQAVMVCVKSKDLS